MFWFSLGVYPSKIFLTICKGNAKVMNDVLVRDFVKMHYQFSAKVMDPNFIKRIAEEADFKHINNIPNLDIQLLYI